MQKETERKSEVWHDPNLIMNYNLEIQLIEIPDSVIHCSKQSKLAK